VSITDDHWIAGGFMSLSREDAAKALEEVGRTQRRSAVLRGYQHGAPHFWLWGVIWMIGFTISDYRPDIAGPSWIVLDVLGCIGGTLLGRRSFRTVHGAGAGNVARTRGLQTFGGVAILIAFLFATYYVLPPTAARQYGAFPGLMMALVYSLVGLAAGLRWLVLGLALFALTLGGYAEIQSHFLLWMAFAGGGSLILTGFWMRLP
jgi:hypothetical protein